MKKVLMCGNHPSNKGGMTSVIEQIMEHDWSKEEIEVRFIPTFKPGNPVKKGAFFLLAYIKILFTLRSFKPDLVHMHMSYKWSFTRKYLIHRLCKWMGIKDAIHLHGSEFQKWYNESSIYKQKKIRKLLKEADYFIVLGKKWKDIILNIEPDSNVCVIGNGISIPNKTVRWEEDGCKFIFLGVLIPRKGVVDLLEAIASIRPYVIINNMNFFIAGCGECEEELRKKAKELNIDTNVKFLGWVSGDEKRKLLESCQIMVSPSYHEGLPISLLEAVSYGMPIISTDVGDVSAVVFDGINGILFTPGDIPKLSKAIIDVAHKDVFFEMSNKSREIANKNSIELFYSKLLNVYMGI